MSLVVGLLALVSELARLRWAECVGHLAGISEEMDLLVAELEQRCRAYNAHRISKATQGADYDETDIALMQKRSRIAAQACHASALGGSTQTDIPSRDMLVVYCCLSAGGYGCRDSFISSLQRASGFSTQWEDDCLSFIAATCKSKR